VGLDVSSRKGIITGLSDEGGMRSRVKQKDAASPQDQVSTSWGDEMREQHLA
jgi:hypothetical protein